MNDSKEPIKLRQRKMPSGNTTLYLDIYINGVRSYEYLKLYLVPERTRADREKNKETLKLADAVRAKRVIELRNGQFGLSAEPEIRKFPSPVKIQTPFIFSSSEQRRFTNFSAKGTFPFTI